MVGEETAARAPQHLSAIVEPMEATAPAPSPGGDWCILRTSGGRTLPLARSLTAAGLDVWTPTTSIERRKGRSRSREDVDAPILPTFLFARAAHLPELRRCLAQLVNPHPPYSIFHYCGRIPIVGDRDIANLRTVERRAQRAAERRHPEKRPTFGPGSRVRCKDGAWAGMSGVVEEEAGKFVLVDFAGSFLVTIDTFLLDPDGL